MQKLTEQIIRLSPPGGFFDNTVVCNLFPDASEGARKQLIHRATLAGEILRLKRGLFLLNNRRTRAYLEGLEKAVNHVL